MIGIYMLTNLHDVKQIYLLCMYTWCQHTRELHNNHVALVQAWILLFFRLQHMGMARVTCEDECSCEPTVLDGHHERKSSVIVMEKFQVDSTKSGNCTLVITTIMVGVGVKLNLEMQMSWARSFVHDGWGKTVDTRQLCMKSTCCDRAHAIMKMIIQLLCQICRPYFLTKQLVHWQLDVSCKSSLECWIITSCKVPQWSEILVILT